MTVLTYARGRDWYTEQRKPHGGFCFIHAESVLTVWQSLVCGDLQLRDVRVWLACHEMVARRCRVEPGRRPRYGLEELAELVGSTAIEHVRCSIRRLSRLGYLDLHAEAIRTRPVSVSENPGRPVPVPRPVLRMLCRERGRAFIATTLGHLLRCLYYRKGVCRSGGWCKASWVAQTFHVAVRAVKDARKRLVGMGLCRLLDADQCRLNRFGRPLLWLLDWGQRPAPPEHLSTTESAPPREHKKLSLRRSDHQKPARPAVPAGVCTQTNSPDLRDVKVADLEDPRRLAALFKQSRARGWVRRCESDILAFLAAAAHALRVGTSNPAGLFRWLVERQKWAYLSCEDEDRARIWLRQLAGRCQGTTAA